MASAESASDPLAEQDTLMSELADLEKQFADRKVKKEEFETLSNKLKERISRAEAQALAMARTDASIAKRLRLRSYGDPEIQSVIIHYLHSGGESLEPEFGGDRIPRYRVETESGDSKMIGQPVLQRMADMGMLTGSLFERIVSCPICGVPSHVYLRFKCTQCGSIDISINQMIEHLQCGTIHQENVFRVGHNLICPTCKKLLQGPDDYRVIGVVCSCNNCHAHFEDPSESFFCRKCSNDFTLPKAIVADVYAYSMTKDALSEAGRFMGVNTLKKMLLDNGILIRSSPVMVGPNKEMAFSLIIQKDARTVAVDVAQSDVEVEVEPVLELYVKTLEATPSAAIFGAVPALSKRARDVASLHNILVAEGETPAKMAEKVIEIVQRL
jgi:hypothetical protein